MSVSLDASTLVKGLWVGKTQGPPVISNGRFLQLHIEAGDGNQARSKEPCAVSCVAFHPADETQVVIGTTQGCLFGVSLRENKAFLLANLADSGSVRAASFCGASVGAGGVGATVGGFPHVVAVSEGSVVTFLNWRTAAVLQQMRCGAHSRAILSVATSPFSTAGDHAAHSQLVIFQSADAISCWVPQNQSHHSRPDSARGVSYNCVGTAKPAQGVVAAKQWANGQTSRRAGTPSSEAHRFLSVHVSGPAVFSTETNGTVAKWAIPPESYAYPSSASSLRLERCVQTLPFRACCAACCPAFLALGSNEGAAVALVDTEKLSGLGVFDITQSTPAAPSSPPPHVQQLSIVRSELVCCVLTDGRVVCVTASTHQCAFLLNPPRAGITRRSCVPLAWRFVPSGPTYGAFFAASSCILYHLPTAKSYHERCLALSAEEGVSPLQIRSGNDSAPHEDEESGGGDVLCFTVKVVPFLTQRHERAERPQALRRPPQSSAGSEHTRYSSTKSQRRFPRKPLFIAAPGRASDSESSQARWIDVNTAEDASERSSIGTNGFLRDEHRAMSALSRALYSDTLGDAACAYNMDKLRQHLRTFGVFPKDFRPAIWRFILGLPDKRRTAPQFASLARRQTHPCVATHMEPFPLPPSPTRAAVEQCISVLAHHSPVFAMTDFLPAFVFPLLHVFSVQDTQSVVEVLLVFFSNWGVDFFQCYPQPPTGLMHFMQRQLAAHDPALAERLSQMGCGPEVWCWQPLLSFYTDILTAAEWLQVMDHAFLMEPMWLFMFHVAILGSQRGVLLGTDGASIHDVLQLLSSPVSQQQLQKAPPLREGTAKGPGAKKEASPRLTSAVADAIKEAYKLYAKCPRDVPFAEQYFHFEGPAAPSYSYPTNFPADADIMAAKMAELHNLEAKRQEESQAADRLRELVRAAEREAVREEVLLQQQRARIAAKYDASSETWRARVALEKATQQREAKEREARLEALRRRVASAEELERMREEMAHVEAQSRHNMVDQLIEQHKWTLASGLTADELERLEHEARARVAAGLRNFTKASPSADGSHIGDSDSVHLEDSNGPGEGAAQQAGSFDSAEDPRGGLHGRDNGSGDGVPEQGSATVTPSPGEPPHLHEAADLPRGETPRNVRDGDSTAIEAELLPVMAADPRDRAPGVDDDPTCTKDGVVPLDGGGETGLLNSIDDEDEEDMEAYNNREEYPGHDEVGDYLFAHAAAPDAHRGSREDVDGDDAGVSALLDDDQRPRSAPLPTHLAPFIPSAEVLKALQQYQGADSLQQPSPMRGAVAGGGGAAPADEICHYPFDRPAFQPDTHSVVVNPYRRQFQILREQAQDNSGIASAPPEHAALARRELPAALKERVERMRSRHHLFDNLSESTITPTTARTRSDTGTTRTTGTLPTSSYVTQTATNTDYSSSPRARAARQGSHPAAGTATATTGSTSAPTKTPTLTTATHTTETPSSSAASALQRPWRDEYY